MNSMKKTNKPKSQIDMDERDQTDQIDAAKVHKEFK
jgi:hypothetical protein